MKEISQEPTHWCLSWGGTIELGFGDGKYLTRAVALLLYPDYFKDGEPIIEKLPLDRKNDNRRKCAVIHIFRKLKERIIWNRRWKAKKGEKTCNSCTNYKSCSSWDVKGEYFANGAKHDGGKICKYYYEASKYENASDKSQ